MDTTVWGIDGNISGHAGAYITFSLGPYIGTPDEGEIQSVVIGLGELLASHGQYVRDARVNAVCYIGDRVLDRALEAMRAIAPDEARQRTEDHWKGLDEYVRSAVKHAPTEMG